MHEQRPPGVDRYAAIAGDIAERGWAVCTDFLPADALRALSTEAAAMWDDGIYRPARIGTGAGAVLRPELRGDHLLWLDEAALTPPQRAYYDRLERLRVALNQVLFLGLFGFEGHLAVYPPGARYRRHLDQFQGPRERIATSILYLNSDWCEADGGQLRLYLDEAGRFMDILPVGGTLVTFLSARFYHEVLPARRRRASLTGWFKVRTGSPL